MMMMMMIFGWLKLVKKKWHNFERWILIIIIIYCFSHWLKCMDKFFKFTENKMNTHVMCICVCVGVCMWLWVIRTRKKTRKKKDINNNNNNKVYIYITLTGHWLNITSEWIEIFLCFFFVLFLFSVSGQNKIFFLVVIWYILHRYWKLVRWIFIDMDLIQWKRPRHWWWWWW